LRLTISSGVIQGVGHDNGANATPEDVAKAKKASEDKKVLSNPGIVPPRREIGE